MLLSGILLPLTLAPSWLRTIASINPLAHAVDATRALINGHVGGALISLCHGVRARLSYRMDRTYGKIFS